MLYGHIFLVRQSCSRKNNSQRFTYPGTVTHRSLVLYGHIFLVRQSCSRKNGKSILQVPDTGTRVLDNTKPFLRSSIVSFWITPAGSKERKYHIFRQYWYTRNVLVFTNTGTFQYLGPEVYFFRKNNSQRLTYQGTHWSLVLYGHIFLVRQSRSRKNNAKRFTYQGTHWSLVLYGHIFLVRQSRSRKNNTQRFTYQGTVKHRSLALYRHIFLVRESCIGKNNAQRFTYKVHIDHWCFMDINFLLGNPAAGKTTLKGSLIQVP